MINIPFCVYANVDTWAGIRKVCCKANAGVCAWLIDPTSIVPFGKFNLI